MITKLTELCEIQYGYAFDSANFTEDSTYPPLVRIRDIVRGYSETYYMGEYPIEYVLHAGDLLIGMDGEFNIARWKSRDALLNQRVCKVVAKEGTSEEYLRFALSKALKKIENRTAFVTVKHLSAKELNKLILNIPSYSAQIVIADTLSKLEHIISSRQQQLQKLDELIKARFVEMFGDLEKTTTIARYISELRGGKSLAGTEPCKNRVLKTGAATFGWFDPEQYKYLPTDYEPLPEHKVETGDVIISRMNTPELVGACSYVFEAPENMYYPDRLWKAVLKEKTNPIFLWQLLWEKDIRKAIKEESGGTSGTMHNISKPNLLGIKCIDAPIELQDKYADFVKQIDKSKVVVQKALDETQTLFDSLMQKYFGTADHEGV